MSLPEPQRTLVDERTPLYLECHRAVALFHQSAFHNKQLHIEQSDQWKCVLSEEVCIAQYWQVQGINLHTCGFPARPQHTGVVGTKTTVWFTRCAMP